jgi:hypothetical protein
MRTRPARILPDCPYCNRDHNPDIECREMPESVRFRLVQARKPPHRELVTDASGKTIAVRTIREE